MRSAFVYMDKTLTADMLAELFTVKEWAPEGSNSRRAQAQAYSQWLDFLQDLEGRYIL
jgi:hypothetical protein